MTEFFEDPHIKSGLYKIQNTKNNKFYIGSSVNIPLRWKEHKWDLKNNKHHNVHLQFAVNKYGLQNFEFNVIKEVAVFDLLAEEQLLLNQYCGTSICYNISKNSVAPGTGRSPSEETRQKMSTRMIGRVRSQEHKDNLSKALTGKILSDETRKKISTTLKGKVESEETKRKKSKAWQGKTNNPDAKLTEIDVLKILMLFEQNKVNRYYKKQLALHYDVSWNTIHRIVTRKIWKHIGVINNGIS
jgi:group I intron endonuclease